MFIGVHYLYLSFSGACCKGSALLYWHGEDDVECLTVVFQAIPWSAPPTWLCQSLVELYNKDHLVNEWNHRGVPTGKKLCGGLHVVLPSSPKPSMILSWSCTNRESSNPSTLKLFLLPESHPDMFSPVVQFLWVHPSSSSGGGTPECGRSEWSFGRSNGSERCVGGVRQKKSFNLSHLSGRVRPSISRLVWQRSPYILFPTGAQTSLSSPD